MAPEVGERRLTTHSHSLIRAREDVVAPLLWQDRERVGCEVHGTPTQLQDPQSSSLGPLSGDLAKRLPRGEIGDVPVRGGAGQMGADTDATLGQQ